MMVITLRSIEVYDADLPGAYDWYTGISACVDLANGWRVPTKEELDAMWKRKDRLGGFANAVYWSSSEFNENYAWIQHFNSGNQYHNYSKGYEYKVRPVRDVV